MRWGGNCVKYVAISLVAILTLPVGVLEAGNESTSSAQSYLPSPWVIILGDDNLTAKNGVYAGTGTESNPFIISDLMIHYAVYFKPLDATISFVAMNTTRHLVIREILVRPEYPSFATSEGVFLLWNCTNVTVEDSELVTAILIRHCSHITINTTLLEAGLPTSILIEDSEDIVIERSSIYGGNPITGIMVKSSSNVRLQEDRIQGCGTGVDLQNSTRVEVIDCLMERNTVDFLDDNPGGANSYSGGRAAFLWTDAKTYLVALVIAIEGSMLVAAAWMTHSRNRKKAKTLKNLPGGSNTLRAGGKNDV